MRKTTASLLGSVLCLLVCCGGQSPEARLRALIDDAVEAAESKNAAAVRDLVSERYADDEGHDRATLLTMIGLHFRQQSSSIYVARQIRSVRADGATAGTATIDVAVAAGPIPDPTRWGEIDADLLRVEIRAEREADGRWRVTRAGWRALGPADLLAR